MAKIIAPNKSYTGVSASVAFCNGIGETDNKHLIEWFQQHNYQIIQEDTDVKQTEKTLDEMTIEQLVEYAEKKGIDIGKATSQSGIIEKIKASITTDSNVENQTDTK